MQNAERLISRRDILKVGLLLGTATVLGACGEKPPQEFTDGTETVGEVEKTLPEQAQAQALDMFTNAMKPVNGLREQEDGLLSHYFKSSSNMDAWESEIPKVLNGEQSLVVLRGSFINSEISGGQYAKAHKTVEELELNNIRTTTKLDQSSELSDADRANGIEWKGIVGIDFIERYRSNRYQIGGSLGVERYRVEAFATADETNPLPSFSSWLDLGLQFNTKLKNGSWEIEPVIIMKDEAFPTMADFFETAVCMGDNPGCVVTTHVDSL